MGVDMPPIRSRGYGQHAQAAGWRDHASVQTVNTFLMPPPSQSGYRPPHTPDTSQDYWDNTNSGKPSRITAHESSSTDGSCSSDSGLSSRSPTPIRHQGDQVQDPIIDLDRNKGIKRHHEVHSPAYTGGSGGGQQYFQPVNVPYYGLPHGSSLYQSKRRFHSGRHSPPSPSQSRYPRGRKLSGVVLPANNGQRRTFLSPPERYLSRSHLVQVTCTPSELVTGGKWDKLSEGIWEKFLANQQTEDTFRKKMQLWNRMYKLIKSCFPRYELYLVGSTMSGFGSDKSDVDMCLQVRAAEMDQRNEAVGHLQLMLKYFRRYDFLLHPTIIQAKVPILKFQDSRQGLEVDLNCNNSVGIRNTHLLYCYSQLDWRVRPLVLIVKLWAHKHGINDAKNMTISSYSLVLMVIHFLQCGVSPPVLPCLHGMYEGKFSPWSDVQLIDMHENLQPFKSENKQSLGELLVGFLQYYVEFDFSQYAISVRLASKLPIEQCRRARTLKNDIHQWKYLCIEEPFDWTNTARSVYDRTVFERIKAVFNASYCSLKKNGDIESIFQLDEKD